MIVIIRILPSYVARGLSDLVKGNGNAAVIIFHEINFSSSKFLTTVVGGHCKVEIELHKALFLYNLVTVSSEGLTSPDSTERLGIHATIKQHVHISQ